jgi:hypothetical protein
MAGPLRSSSPRPPPEGGWGSMAVKLGFCDSPASGGRGQTVVYPVKKGPPGKVGRRPLLKGLPEGSADSPVRQDGVVPPHPPSGVVGARPRQTASADGLGRRPRQTASSGRIGRRPRQTASPDRVSADIVLVITGDGGVCLKVVNCVN